MRKSKCVVAAVFAACLLGDAACSQPTEDVASTSDAEVTELQINIERQKVIDARHAVEAIDQRGRAELAALAPALDATEQNAYRAAFMTTADFTPARKTWNAAAIALEAQLAKIDWGSTKFTLRPKDNESVFAMILSDYVELAQSPHAGGALVFSAKLAKDAHLRGEFEKALDRFKGADYFTAVPGLEKLGSAKSGADALRIVRELLSAKSSTTELLDELFDRQDPTPAIDAVTNDLTAAWSDNPNIVKGVTSARDILRTRKFSMDKLDAALEAAGLDKTQDKLLFRTVRSLGASYAVFQARDKDYWGSAMTILNNGGDAAEATAELIRAWQLAASIKPVSALGDALGAIGKAGGKWGNIVSTLLTMNLAQDDKMMAIGQAIYLIGAILSFTPADLVGDLLQGVGQAVELLAAFGEARGLQEKEQSEMNECLLAMHMDTYASALSTVAARNADRLQTLGDAHVGPEDVRWLVVSSNWVYDGEVVDGVVALGRTYKMATASDIGAFLHAIVAGETDKRRIAGGLDEVLGTIGPVPKDTNAPQVYYTTVFDDALKASHANWPAGGLEGVTRADAYLKKRQQP